MTDRERLERLLLERSVQRGHFTLASGSQSSYYIDCRLTTMSAEGLNLIGRCGLDAIASAGWEASAVGGLTMGADPVAYAISAASFGTQRQLDAFSVRKEAKNHGTKRQIEGNFTSGARVIIAEDVITSGGSALQAARAVEGAGGTVAGVLAVVDREQGGKQKIIDSGYRVVALTTARSLGLEEK
jgi:orotate phosphoribosyltransferase